MRRDQLNRRKLIALLGGATASILSDSATKAQQPVPFVGLLRTTPAAPFKNLVTALREGLAAERFVEGRTLHPSSIGPTTSRTCFQEWPWTSSATRRR